VGKEIEVEEVTVRPPCILSMTLMYVKTMLLMRTKDIVVYYRTPLKQLAIIKQKMHCLFVALI